ncbi:uncharacterized protein LOC132402218 [Hypanus sabinus]|uniref:uncharacterized protein LOC132402218 n=1 Tax=Hypanus sabinus TaxID=79690 RepID=UPI0028C3CA76|nr:uncharacterized protein LOC132402218 [Hypanus sabinus]XP_059840957.1 uncharacterized protein LOC132402218 [Hypanus sabinus]XP_059840967.1 uncharacterized protein LOC132402218 [Hypanus sabinus]XP_059840976.1 uncharacterized protein LOC132402218 [Hypanus sabinus]
MVDFLPSSISLGLCARRRRNKTTLASWVQEVVQFTPSQINPLRIISTLINLSQCLRLKPLQLTMTLARIVHCITNPTPSKKCRTFREKPLEERMALLKEKKKCFKCCSSTSHLARECTITVKCPECNSTNHDRAMHPMLPQTDKAPSPPQQDGGEGEAHSRTTVVSSSCTEVCGQAQSSRSCSKICLTKVYPKGAKDKAIKAYVILDDQSNRSLVSPEFFDLFNIESNQFPYYLRTCSGSVETYGRKAEGFQLESLDGKVVIYLPPLLECNEIMKNRTEIPTPSAVLHEPHLHHITKRIPELDPKAEILLLLGRDVFRVHKVRQQVNGPHDAPFAQRLDLGWVVIGEVCLGNVHKPTVSTLKTNVLESGRHLIFQPRTSFMCIKENTKGKNKKKKKKGKSAKCNSEISGECTIDLSTQENLGNAFHTEFHHEKTKESCNSLEKGGQQPVMVTQILSENHFSQSSQIPTPCLPDCGSRTKTLKRKPEMQQRTRLTHEVLCTLMAEVTAIINARPLLPVSSDPKNPFILSPSMLLTQKAGAPPLHQGTSLIRICTQSNGGRSRLWQIGSGLVGDRNIYLCCNTDKSGQNPAGIFKLAI